MGLRHLVRHLPYVLTTMGRTGFSIMLVAAALGAAACGKGPGQAPDRVSISFEALDPAVTKALSPEAEDRVETLDLLVFRAGDGMLDAYERSRSSLRVGASVTAGTLLRWYVVANAPEGALEGYGTEWDFLSGETFLGESPSLTMHAAGTGVFMAGETGRLISGIRLLRYACKVSVREVRVSWLGAFAQSPSCTLDRAVLVNVRGSCPWSGDPTAEADDVWLNPSRDDPQEASVQELLAWDGPITVSGPGPLPLEVALYALPNPSSGDGKGSGPWSPRKTRLCLRFTIDGIPNWYAAELPPMSGNRHYVLSHLVIDGPGMANPDDALVRTQISFHLQVQDWEDSWNDLSFE